MESLSNSQGNTVITEGIDTPLENPLNRKLRTAARHLFLTLCVLLAISIVFFLIYQNGKSIYDKGI